MDKINTEKLCRMIAGCDGRIVITAHIRPDGDAIGSTTALLHFLREAGKDACIVLPDKAPESLSFITEHIDPELIISTEDDYAKASEAVLGSSLIFCLDFNKFQETRCGRVSGLLSEARCPKILIDHHLYPEREQFDLVYSEPEISSTAELLFWVLMATPTVAGDPHKLSLETATSLFTGMTTDTNNFANSVRPSTLRMASLLLERGVDRDGLLEHIFQEYPERRLRLLGRLLDSNMKITDDGVAYMILDRKTMDEYGIQEGETEGFVNEPLAIGRVRMSILIKEDREFIRVSLRSKRGVSANKCAAEFFNGGGHELASGGRLYIPENISSFSEAAAYVEKVTHIFMNRNNDA